MENYYVRFSNETNSSSLLPPIKLVPIMLCIFHELSLVSVFTTSALVWWQWLWCQQEISLCLWIKYVKEFVMIKANEFEFEFLSFPFHFNFVGAKQGFNKFN